MQEVTDKERAETLKRVMSTPIGAGRRFLVKCGNDDCAGFDTHAEATAYVAMMRKGSDKAKAPACSKMNWTITDRG